MQTPARSPTGLLVSRFQVQVLGGSLSFFLQIAGNARAPAVDRGSATPTATPTRLSEDLVHRAAYPSVHALEDTGVGVKGQGYRGVSQEFLDIHGMDVAAKQQRGAGMAKVVEAGVGGQIGTLQQRLERAHDVAVG